MFFLNRLPTKAWPRWQVGLISRIGYSINHLILGVIVVLLLSLQGCATEKIDVVIPSLEHSHNWSIDAANNLHYRESFFGARLSILISPELMPGPAITPLRMELLFGNGFETAFQLDTQQIFISSEGKIYSATVASCRSLGHSQLERGEAGLVIIRKLSRGERWPCIELSFNIPQPVHWESVTMRILGLTKNNVKITVPEIRFHKIRKSVGGSFI